MNWDKGVMVSYAISMVCLILGCFLGAVTGSIVLIGSFMGASAFAMCFMFVCIMVEVIRS